MAFDAVTIANPIFLDDIYVAKLGDASVGISQLQKNKINIFPSPTNGQFTIDLPGNTLSGTIKIIDFSGRIVQAKNITAAQQTINTGNLAKGIYLINVTIDTGAVIIEKIIIQ